MLFLCFFLRGFLVFPENSLPRYLSVACNIRWRVRVPFRPVDLDFSEGLLESTDPFVATLGYGARTINELT